MKTGKATAYEIFDLMLDGGIVDEQRAAALIQKLNHTQRQELREVAQRLDKLIEQITAIGMFRLKPHNSNKLSRFDTQS